MILPKLCLKSVSGHAVYTQIFNVGGWLTAAEMQRKQYTWYGRKSVLSAENPYNFLHILLYMYPSEHPSWSNSWFIYWITLSKDFFLCSISRSVGGLQMVEPFEAKLGFRAIQLLHILWQIPVPTTASELICVTLSTSGLPTCNNLPPLYPQIILFGLLCIRPNIGSVLDHPSNPTEQRQSLIFISTMQPCVK